MFFFLSSTGQAGFIQVGIPIRGNSQLCRKNHPARINRKINKSDIAYSFIKVEAGKTDLPFSDCFPNNLFKRRIRRMRPTLVEQSIPARY